MKKQLRFLFIIFLLFFVHGCQKEATMEDIEAQNRILVQRWIDEVWTNMDPAAIDEILAENIQFNYAPEGIEVNREGYKQTMALYADIFTEKRFTLHDMVVEGNKVAARWSSESIHSAEFMGIAPTGKKIKESGISILRIEEGKIVEEWTEVDMFGILLQIGFFSQETK